MRAAVVVSAIISTSVALSIKSIYWLLFLLGEVQYSIMVSQFLCAVFLPKTNTYGSIAAIAVGLVLRIGAGDPLLGIPTVIKYPFYSDIYGQLFPFKTLCMLSSLATLVAVSYLARFLFLSGTLPLSADFLRRFRECSSKKEAPSLNTDKKQEDTHL